MSGVSLAIRRVILFTHNLADMAHFYRDILGLKVVGEEPGWLDLDGGGCRLALHEARFDGAEGPAKIAFFAEDVAAARAELITRGATGFGEVKAFGTLRLCDGIDPDGNAVQLSNRP